MQSDCPFTRAEVANITGIPARRLRNHLDAALPFNGRRLAGEWRRLTAREVFQIALIDAAMICGATRRDATTAVSVLLNKLFMRRNPPMAAIPAIVAGNCATLTAQRGLSATLIHLHQIATEVAAAAATLRAPAEKEHS